MPVRKVDDMEVLSRDENGGLEKDYCGLGKPQFLQVFRTGFEISEFEQRRDGVQEKVLGKLVYHLDMITKHLELGRSGVLPPISYGDSERRTMAGRLEFLEKNPATADMTPGILALMGRVLVLKRHVMGVNLSFAWYSVLGLGFVEDGAGEEWNDIFSAEKIMDLVGGVKEERS
jgi:hypothetical protein